MLNIRRLYIVFSYLVMLAASSESPIVFAESLSKTTRPASASNELTIETSPRYQALRDAVFRDEYEALPYYKVSKALFKKEGKESSNQLLNDARRTLSDNRDLLGSERGQKLLQANGICFSGEWHIDRESEFSGLFKVGSRTPVIARASVSFSGTKQNERRALGLAVKLLPSDLGSSASLNVFTLHSVGGVKTKYLLDLALDNEPPLGRIPRFRDIPTALKLKSELLKADKEVGSVQPSITFRSIESLAAYKEVTPTAPRWIRFSSANSARSDKQDFRDELRVENYPSNELVYQIEVASNPEKNKSKANWVAIGQLIFKESITSKVCDTQLHFAHPKN